MCVRLCVRARVSVFVCMCARACAAHGKRGQSDVSHTLNHQRDGDGHRRTSSFQRWRARWTSSDAAAHKAPNDSMAPRWEGGTPTASLWNRVAHPRAGSLVTNVWRWRWRGVTVVSEIQVQESIPELQGCSTAAKQLLKSGSQGTMRDKGGGEGGTVDSVVPGASQHGNLISPSWATMGACFDGGGT